MSVKPISRDEHGATAITVAITMVLLMGMAAIAIDLGLGFNERRQDQTAADLGVMAGGIHFLDGAQEISANVLEFVWNNLPSADPLLSWDTDTAFIAAFRGCLDPERDSLALGLQPLPEPSAWGGLGTLECVSASTLGFVRVRVPDQFTNTGFARIIGFDQLTTSADAVAQLVGRGRLGILPFGLPSGVAGGEHLCLSSGPTGLAEDPCTGPDSGNFGTLKIPQWGHPDLGTTENCNSVPVGDTLAINIAVGIDHIVFLADSTDAADEIRDNKPNCEDKTFEVNTLDTDTGFPNNGAEQGLVGPLPGGAPADAQPRLLNSDDTKNLFGVDIDDKPLWAYLSSTLDGGYPPAVGTTNIPEVCDPDTFRIGYTPSVQPHPTPGDWNGDAIPDKNDSWEHMQYCLIEYVATYDTSGPWAELFTTGTGGIAESPRFSYAPEFHELSLGMGNTWLHIKQFRPVWIQGTWWKKGNDWSVFHPREGCDNSGGGSCAANEDLKQISALVIPDLALPLDLRGNPPPTGQLNPFEPLLYK
jgi:hypothetical protein